MRVIGLTGGIGAGKSEVARVFRQAGVPVVDADCIAREQMRRGQPVYDEVVAAFGQGVLGPDGEVDRKALARLVFPDPARRETLNRITHPPVVEEVERRLAVLGEMGCEVAVVEAALLVETGLHTALDGLLVVTAPEEERIARVAARDHVGPEEVRLRVAAQVSDAERASVATWLLRNDGSLADLRARALDLVLKTALIVGGQSRAGHGESGVSPRTETTP